jgi:hypothetical protein
MPVPNEQGQRLVAVTAVAGSASQAALTLLAQATTPDGRTRPATENQPALPEYL